MIISIKAGDPLRRVRPMIREYALRNTPRQPGSGPSKNADKLWRARASRASAAAIRYSLTMSEPLRPPCRELLRVADVIDQMIGQYCSALRRVGSIGRWEAPKEGLALGWLLIRNVEAVILMARSDEVLVTATWSNSRVAFELSARIIWMLQHDDRYEAECRWLAFLLEWENAERRLARDIPDHADRHNRVAETIKGFREGVTKVLPSGYRAATMPNFRDMLQALDSLEMYQFYREGSQYVHGNLYASRKYSNNLGTERNLGDFTSTADWILPLKLCWLSTREATKFILVRLDVPDDAMPNWNEMNRDADAAFEALAIEAVRQLGIT